MKLKQPYCIKCDQTLDCFVPEGHEKHIWALCYGCAVQKCNPEEK